MGKKTIVYADFNDARNFATLMETNYAVRSHLIFGAEYDSVLEWFLESGIKTKHEIEGDASEWGNCNIDKRKLEETGSRNKWCANNIYDFAGNIEEWTQEYYEKKDEKFVVRGEIESKLFYSVSVREWRYKK